MKYRNSYLVRFKMVLFLTFAHLVVLPLLASDWPMWRCDAGRTANSTGELPAQMKLQWVREFSPRVPAWEDPLNRDLMTYDTVFEPVVLGSRMFVGFNDSDKLMALDAASGRELWRFYADGPVRLAPAAWRDNVYFVSDDGYLYCLRAKDGSLAWKVLGGPSNRKVLGNSRLVSAWPARGGPVIRDGVVYFAASIWPFTGTFIYALNAATGQSVWVNDGTGAEYVNQPHNAPAFGGVAPQGALVATENVLLVPGGRSVPAAFDRATGKLLYFNLAESSRGYGGSTVMAGENEFFVHTREKGVCAYELDTGRKTKFVLNEPVLDGDCFYCAAECSTGYSARVMAEKKLESARYAELKAKQELSDAKETGEEKTVLRAQAALKKTVDKLSQAELLADRARQSAPAGQPFKVVQAWNSDKSLLWEIEADGSCDLIRAGSRLYAAGSNTVAAISLPGPGKQPVVEWTQPVKGTLRRLLAANGMLFAVTLEGYIMAFGGANNPPVVIKEEVRPFSPSPAVIKQARAITVRTGVHDGYAFCLGCRDGELSAVLAELSQLHIIGVEPDAARVDLLRRQLDAAGLYGKRLTLLAGDPGAFGAPPYIASLVVVDNAFVRRLGDASVLSRIYESVRPYGGCLWAPDKLETTLLPKAKVQVAGNAMLIIREGSLPGAADWTHQYGDVANTVKSDDKTVKLPVGLLWFGGNTHMDVLPRHGHGPSEQVTGGRLFIEGMDGISARDVYTGRRLWKTAVPGLNTQGIYYDNTHLTDPLTTLYSQRHLPGANARGANFVATEDSVYVAVSNRCVVLNAASGAIVRCIDMPYAKEWGYIGVCGDVLLGGTGFAHFNRRFSFAGMAFMSGVGDVAASTGLAAFNRCTGEQLWRVDAQHSFFHNGIVAGGGRVYCIDRLPKSAELKARTAGRKTTSGYRIVAFDLHTGDRLWENTNGVFGTWLSYSKERDLLLHAGAGGSDRWKDEAKEGMAVLRAKDGTEIWHNANLKYTGPCILHNDLVITTPTSYKQSAGAYSLLDGKPHMVTNPLTGEAQPWRIYRTYGCNTPVASEYLMTFRSGAAGFYDLAGHGGTGNLGGFKSGCSANLIIANGVLNAPDYTRTCSCAYQNQTSLAMVPVPETEVWTYNLSGLDIPKGKRIVRVGVNLGAPGDRLAPDGTLWLEYPATPGASPQLPVIITSAGTNTFRRHSSAVSGEGLAWVAASGLRDLESIVIVPQAWKTVAPDAPVFKDDNDDSVTNKTGVVTKVVVPAMEIIPMPSTNYTVRLYFMEPDRVEPGQRVFDVFLQGHPVLKSFDVLKVAGRLNSGVVREFRNIQLNPALEVRLQKLPASLFGPVLSGVEIIMER